MRSLGLRPRWCGLLVASSLLGADPPALPTAAAAAPAERPLHRLRAGARNLPRRRRPHRLDQPRPAHGLRHACQGRDLARARRISHRLGRHRQGQRLAAGRLHPLQDRATSASRPGQFKTPFTREFITSLADVETADRATVVDSLAPKRDIGVMADYAIGSRLAP